MALSPYDFPTTLTGLSPSDFATTLWLYPLAFSWFSQFSGGCWVGFRGLTCPVFRAIDAAINPDVTTFGYIFPENVANRRENVSSRNHFRLTGTFLQAPKRFILGQTPDNSTTTKVINRYAANNP